MTPAERAARAALDIVEGGDLERIRHLVVPVPAR